MSDHVRVITRNMTTRCECCKRRLKEGPSRWEALQMVGFSAVMTGFGATRRGAIRDLHRRMRGSGDSV